MYIVFLDNAVEHLLDYSIVNNFYIYMTCLYVYI